MARSPIIESPAWVEQQAGRITDPVERLRFLRQRKICAQPQRTHRRRTGLGQVASLIDRPLTAQLLWNTIRLGVVVTALCAVIGTGAAWLTERTNLPGRRVWAVLLVAADVVAQLTVEAAIDGLGL